MRKKGAVLTFILRLLSPIFSVIIVKLLNAKGPNEYADYLIFFGYVNIIGVIGTLGLNSSYVKIFANRPGVGYKTFLYVSARPFVYTLTLVVLQVTILSFIDDISIGYILTLFFASLAKIWYDITAEVSFVYNKVIGSVGAHAGPLIIYSLGIIWLDQYNVLVLYACSYLLSLILIQILSLYSWKQFDKSFVEINLNLRLYIVPILSTIAAQMFIVLRGQLSLSNEYLGSLGILSRVGSVLTLSLTMFNVVLAPRFAEKDIFEAWRFFRLLLKYNFVIVSVAFLLSMLFLEDIFEWFLLENPLGYTCSFIFLFSFYFNAATGPIGVFALMTGNEDLSVKIIFTAIILMLLTVLLLAQRPVLAIVLSYLVYSIVANGGLFYLTKRRVNV